MRYLTAALLAALSVAPLLAFAQSAPNWAFGYVPTPNEWNTLWASKQDVAGMPTVFASPPPLGSVTPSTGAFSTLTVNSTSQLNATLTGTRASLFPGATQFATGLIVPALNINTNLTGTQTGAGFWGWNTIVVNADTLAATGSGGGVNDLSIVHNFGGTGYSGDRVGLFMNMTQTGAIAGTPGVFANVPVGAQFSMTLANSFGGTGTTPSTAAGNTTILNPFLAFLSGATNLAGGSGMEMDFTARTGSSYMDMDGILIVRDSLDVVQGTRNNIVFDIDNQYTQTSGRGWKSILGVGDAAGFFPLDPAGSVITFNTASGTMDLANFMDASGITFSSFFIKFPGGQIDTTGAVRSPQLIATSAADANYVLVNPAATGGGPSVWFAGSDTSVNGEVYSQGTGSFYVGTQPSGALMAQFTPAASSVSWLQIKPAASGSSLTLDVAGTATGIVIGGSSATSTRFGSSTSDTILGSGTFMPSLSATAGFMHFPFTAPSSGSGGIPTGTPSNVTSGPACEWNDVTFTLNCYSPGAGAWKHVTFSASAG